MHLIMTVYSDIIGAQIPHALERIFQLEYGIESIGLDWTGLEWIGNGLSVSRLIFLGYRFSSDYICSFPVKLLHIHTQIEQKRGCLAFRLIYTHVFVNLKEQKNMEKHSYPFPNRPSKDTHTQQSIYKET